MEDKMIKSLPTFCLPTRFIGVDLKFMEATTNKKTDGVCLRLQ